MRVGFIGCVDSSRMALETLISVEGIDLCAVVTRNQSAVNSDFCDLTDICKREGIPYHVEDPRFRVESTHFLGGYNLDVIFCIGWSYLLDEELLSMPRIGVIGFHPAKLPQNRGRHPIIWALALGLNETASTFFKMDKGADSGPIISQAPVSISLDDDAQSLYDKIIETARKQILEFAIELVNGSASFIEQDHTKATYWRKRSRKDGLIDFRMSAISIYNLVRALAPPYPNAEICVGKQAYLVKASRISDRCFDQNIEPGKVLEKQPFKILVKTSGAQAIWLDCSEPVNVEVGEYL